MEDYGRSTPMAMKIGIGWSWRLEMAVAWSAGDSSTWRSDQYFLAGYLSIFGLAGNPATKHEA